MSVQRKLDGATIQTTETGFKVCATLNLGESAIPVCTPEISWEDAEKAGFKALLDTRRESKRFWRRVKEWFR